MGQIDFDGSNSTVKADIIRGQTGTTVKLGGLLDTDGNYIQTEKGGDLTSASPLVIDTDGDYFDVTGTTNFAAMTVAADRQFTLQFDGVLTMTHHATNLDLPGEANITTAAGDVATFQSTGSNTVQCINYTRADGTGVVAAAGGNKYLWALPTATNSDREDGQGGWTSLSMEDAASNSFWGSFIVPSDFVSLTTVYCVVSTPSAGNINARFFAHNAGDGESKDAQTDAISADTYALGSETIDFIDVTASSDGLTLAPGDALSYKCLRQGAQADDTINDKMHAIGYYLIYA